MTDELQRLAGELAQDYVYGRWRPQALEEQHARLLAAEVGADGGLDGLAMGGLPAQPSSDC